jgi:hypothetical protein
MPSREVGRVRISWSLVSYVIAALLALLMAVGHLIGVTAGQQVLPWALFFFILGHILP